MDNYILPINVGDMAAVISTRIIRVVMTEGAKVVVTIPLGASALTFEPE